MVLRLARRRQFHPDPEIALAAWCWAGETTNRPGRRARDGVFGVLLSFVDSGLGGGWLGMAFAERRAAKKIMRLGEPTKL
jgi:hypothetical protein